MLDYFAQGIILHLGFRQPYDYIFSLKKFDMLFLNNIRIKTSNIMFKLYRVDFITLWKSYQIGFLLTLPHKYGSWFSYWIAIIAQQFQKWRIMWGKVFKKGQSKICGRQPLKSFQWYGLPQQTISRQIF